MALTRVGRSSARTARCRCAQGGQGCGMRCGSGQVLPAHLCHPETRLVSATKGLWQEAPGLGLLPQPPAPSPCRSGVPVPRREAEPRPAACALLRHLRWSLLCHPNHAAGKLGA